MIAEPAMSQRLTRDNLRGVWAAITTPFDDNDRFDEGAFRENIRRLHSLGSYYRRDVGQSLWPPGTV